MSSVEFKCTSLEEIESTHATLNAEFLKWRTRSIAFRKQQLAQLAYMVKDNQSRFQEALAHDLGKPALESYLHELVTCMKDATDAYNNVDEWAKADPAPFNPQYFLLKPKIRKEPKGVVLIIGAFNYPAFLVLGPMSGAIAAGNAVVIKPSESAPATSSLLAELVPKYLDPSLYRVVNGGVDEMKKLLELKWDHIMFTGGGRVGRIVASEAAKHLTPVTLELGGKNPVIIDPKYDLSLAARRVAWGRFTNAGQICVSPDYLLIPAEVQDKFIDEFKNALERFYPEGPSKSDSFARIATDAHFARLKRLLDNTKGQIVAGGEANAEEKYIAPTLVKNVSPDDALLGEEIFGPILPIVTVKDVDDAIAFINARDHPLALYVFSDDATVKKKVLDSTRSGSAFCNEVLLQAAVDGLPFGGVGGSGYGSHLGKWGFATFTHFRATLDSPKFTELIMRNRYPPYNDKKLNTMSKMITPKLPPRGGVPRSLLARLRSWISVLLYTLAIVGLVSRLAPGPASRVVAFVRQFLSER